MCWVQFTMFSFHWTQFTLARLEDGIIEFMYNNVNKMFSLFTVFTHLRLLFKTFCLWLWLEIFYSKLFVPLSDFFRIVIFYSFKTCLSLGSFIPIHFDFNSYEQTFNRSFETAVKQKLNGNNKNHDKSNPGNKYECIVEYMSARGWTLSSLRGVFIRMKSK